MNESFYQHKNRKTCLLHNRLQAVTIPIDTSSTHPSPIRKIRSQIFSAKNKDEQNWRNHMDSRKQAAFTPAKTVRLYSRSPLYPSQMCEEPTSKNQFATALGTLGCHKRVEKKGEGRKKRERETETERKEEGGRGGPARAERKARRKQKITMLCRSCLATADACQGKEQKRRKETRASPKKEKKKKRKREEEKEEKEKRKAKA